MITFRQINIENRKYYIFKNMINIKNFDPNLLSIDKISFKSTDAVIYNIKNITMKSLDHVNTDNKNPPYITFSNIDGYIIKCNSIEEINGYKYLILLLQTRTKKYLKSTQIFGMKTQIKTINGGKPIEYKKYFNWVKSKSNDNLGLGKISIPSKLIDVGPVRQKDNRCYPQVYLHERLYEFVNES